MAMLIAQNGLQVNVKLDLAPFNLGATMEFYQLIILHILLYIPAHLCWREQSV